MKSPSHLTRTLVLSALSVGILAPVVALIINLSGDVQDWSFAGLADLQPVQWILVLTPVIWGVSFFLLSKVIVSRENDLQEAVREEREQYIRMADLIANFEHKDYSLKKRKEGEDSAVLKMLENIRDKYHNKHAEENQRNWINDGLARFARVVQQEDTVEGLSDAIIQFVLKYLRYGSGALFIPSEADSRLFLDLVSYHAFNEKNYLSKRIAIGEGLIGQCFIDRRSLIIDDVPEGYLKISSGLGEAPPSHLIIYPLVRNGHVHGVIEMAGFHKLQPHELDFLDSVSENIINALLLVTSNEKSRKLLLETRLQTEQLLIREEEMRENIVKMKAQEKEYLNRIETLEWSYADLLRKEWEYKNKLDILHRQLEQDTDTVL